MTLPFSDARALVDGVRAQALELGKALSIAVVDYGGFVVLIERMNGARPMTPDISLSKAYSAAVMQRPTAMLENWRQSDPVFFTQVGRMGQPPIVPTGRLHAQARRRDHFRYHIDHHGSLVRPAGRRAARAAGEPEALAAAEEEAVIAALHVQRRLGISAVGDGQFRRKH